MVFGLEGLDINPRGSAPGSYLNFNRPQIYPPLHRLKGLDIITRGKHTGY